ncbi:DJ-1/PfpI family protein [Fusibacter ferrireducens]|uniref:DJ-1/PfpI family protein n=1 Tax=Fusibacter ferrireducens TaxID=2785058 RepID=A0ABR9ZM21_9FIRM|nr:DJ-1/PfpI family protein [Fusibacter ferrireducens]MBF4691523.1 DJ-1/PfpI family protein [Fusibacter ferrireducens]
MKEVLFFIFDNMTDYEITFTMHMINTSENFKAITIAYEDKEIIGRSGAIYRPHRLVSDEQNIKCEGLILCGGWYGDLRPELKDLIGLLHKEEKLLGGICGAGTFLLAKAGVLENVRYTTPIVEWTDEHRAVFGPADVFPRNNYIEKPVVRDQNVITSLGNSFIDFTAEICNGLGAFESESDKEAFLAFMKQ